MIIPEQTEKPTKQKQIASVEKYYEELKAPRINRTKKHKLMDIVIIAVCGVICGANTWVDIENFGNAKREWLEKYLELLNGIPSHGTFGRVFARIDAEQFQTCFMKRMKAVIQKTNGEVLAIDGKKLRRSHDKTIGKNAIHMVSAWATENRLVLAQSKVDEKSNELTSIDFRDVEHDYHRTVDKGHGRIEIRKCWTISDPLYLNYIRNLSSPITEK